LELSESQSIRAFCTQGNPRDVADAAVLSARSPSGLCSCYKSVIST
jgi:hypothetical protein